MSVSLSLATRVEMTLIILIDMKCEYPYTPWRNIVNSSEKQKSENLERNKEAS